MITIRTIAADGASESQIADGNDRSCAHFGGILIPPSTRTTSAFMYEFVTS